MDGTRRFTATALLALFPLPAAASDADGLLTFLVGLPILVVSTALLWWAARPRRRMRSRALVLVAVAAPLAYVVYLVPDALALLRRYPHGSWPIAVLFFALLMLVVALMLRLMRQGAASVRRAR